MKTKLPYLLVLLSLVSFGQTPISSFYSIEGSTYAVVTSSSAIDQTVSGANLTWDFTNLSTNGVTTVDTYSAPTSGEIAAYPGTTTVLTITDNAMGTSKIFTKNVTSTISFTGAERTDLALNYSNNGEIGTFPMNYGISNSDPVAGNFSYTTYSGTFTGTILAEADAYGTLNLNDLGEGAFSGNVTRLKIVQSFTLSVTNPFPISVPASQTTYNYYDASNGNLVFRTNNLTVNLLSIDETLMESLLPFSTLDVEENEITTSNISIIPNPVGAVLNVRINQNETIGSITLTDITGRQVLTVSDNLTSVSVSNLQAGIYVATIITDKGLYTLKFFKK